MEESPHKISNKNPHKIFLYHFIIMEAIFLCQAYLWSRELIFVIAWPAIAGLVILSFKILIEK